MGELWTVCSDFDGTMTERIVLEALDEALGGRGAPALDGLYRSGRIGLVEYTARRFAPYRVTEEELLTIVRRRVPLRPGVTEAVRLCRERGVRLRVLSSGLDAYLVPLLEPAGVRADEVTCARTLFTGDGIVAEAPPDVGGLDFKAAAVAEEVAAGRRVLYVGDGSNDRVAAERAAFVLARRRLLDHCRARGIAHAPFGDFHDVAAWIARNVGGG